MCLPLGPLRSEHRLACVGRKRPDKVRKTISFEFARQGHQVNMRRIRRPNLDRQVEGGDDGEITLAAKPFASKCAHILPDGMDPVGVRKTDRHHNEQVFRSEEHTSELQSLMRISYAVFCLKKK